MQLLYEPAQAYAERYTTSEDELLTEIHHFTVTHHPHAQMLSGHLQGKILEMVSCMIRPERILEIGTFTGYSALCMAKGLTENGQLHTLELREEDANRAKSYFERSIFKEKIILHQGNALDLIEGLAESWDLVFIDADKGNYINYFNLVFPRLKKNGFILADNVLFHGAVLEEEIIGKNALAIQAFNDYVASRDDVERLLLPVRDGIMILRKLV